MKLKGYGKYARSVGMDPSYTLLEKAVFAVLCCSVNSSLGYAWITVGEIANRVPCSTASVNRALKTLEAAKVIKREGYHHSHGKSTRITWVLV